PLEQLAGAGHVHAAAAADGDVPERAGQVGLAGVPPPEFFAGDVAADVDGAHEPAVFVQRIGRGPFAGCWLQRGYELAVGSGPGCSSPAGEDRTLAGRRRGGHMSWV